MTDQMEILFASIGLINSKSLVLDIGAYVGNISSFLCKQSNGNPKNYYLVEACKQNYNVLENRNYGFNTYNCAISNKTGVQKFYSGNHSGSMGTSQANSLYEGFIKNKEWNKKTTEYEIPSYTLDNFIDKIGLKEIDYLKINCEGGEYKIFEGSLEFLNKSKIIYLQLHGKDPLFLTKEYRDKKRSINNFLLGKGYAVNCGDSPDLVDKTDGHTQQLWVKNA